MAEPSKQPEPAGETGVTPDVKKSAPTSPARSDKSSDSEGKPVRDKLEKTRIDAQSTTQPAKSSDEHMTEAQNGSAHGPEHSTSGSDSDRGRLRRKRSREDFEDENEADRHTEKKLEKENQKERHHVRKRSRDVKDIESGLPLKPPAASVTRIDENDGDELMTTPQKNTSKVTTTKIGSDNDTSPKNKRTRDQVEANTTAATEAAITATANGKPVGEDDEREAKRPKDKDDAQSAANANGATTKVCMRSTAFSSEANRVQIPPGSGFANISAQSPFAAMSPKAQAAKSSEGSEALPQTSEDKFKASGFGSLAKAASPFGGLANPGSQSPFGAASGSKLSSFGSSTASTAAPTSGFGALGGSSKSSFGGSTFGSTLGGGFGAIGGAKPALSSFATPSDLTIKGLKSKPSAFGTPGDDKNSDGSDEEDGNDDDADKDKDNDDEPRSAQALLSPTPHETGEEGEITVWTGRAKLYTLVGEGTSKSWKERGVGPFKFNITVDEPKKARFVLRADGTHRLLLNAAVTKQLVFGGDSEGAKPKEGRLLFNAPTSEGELEMHLLKLKAESAVKLWEEVSKIQETEL
ncbi:hypothetical protein IQ06DRAFT_314285 [Phaeosphaeriaceae sp. SRC1lsM3a]|nr:hypothetical protein IQ06DRAFT_314285 [Stagonospora sp. SRC1lsM3a]